MYLLQAGENIKEERKPTLRAPNVQRWNDLSEKMN